MIARRPKLAKCRQCKAEFILGNPMVRFCSPLCIRKHSEVLAAKVKHAEVKQDRAETAKRRVDAKTIPQLIAIAQTAFNNFIRARDEDQPCICCGRFAFTDLRAGHQWDAGHYRSRGSAGHLRFNEDNCHRQLAQCNRGHAKTGHLRAGVSARIGLERVEALDANNAVHKWSREELIGLTKTYRLKLKLLKAAK